MKWQLRIQDPSGETRLQQLPIDGSHSVSFKLSLKDPTAPREGITLSWVAERNAFWLQMGADLPPFRLGDHWALHAQIPPDFGFMIGETRLLLESVGPRASLPTFPTGVRPWLTVSESGRETLWMTKKAAATPLSIYIAGETGAGKEVLANLVHAWSDRAAGPFVPLHCGALPLSLAESELFGHVKGAFTGASLTRPGALMQAHGGTLFLDEIGDLPLDIQVKLLRFLENGEIKPVGADRSARADVRIVSATHHPLKQLVEEGKFRRDLYYRLASVTVEIPPLRARTEDVEMLACSFASALNRTLSPQALLRLKAHSWPGNVRELRHAIERASGLAGPFVTLLTETAFDFLLSSDPVRGPELEIGAAVLTLQEMERVLILKALRLSHGNRTDAAKILGIARSTLFEMLKRHRIPGPRLREVS